MSFGPVEALLLNVLFVAVLVLLVIRLARWLAEVIRHEVRDESRGRGIGRTAREILDERYARGEIGREEYETMRRDIAG